jgi:undecaprenyl-diphosphatase
MRGGRRAPLALPPLEAERAFSRMVKRQATPFTQEIFKILTFAADEKPLVVAAALYWCFTRGAAHEMAQRSRADHLLICAAVSAVLPHLMKHLVDRERPDRKLVHGPRHGIPRSGAPMDSFPSGHALHLGALAAGLTRNVPMPVAAFTWVSVLALASTRVLLLAHYLSDVIGGLALGVVVEGIVARVCAAGRKFPENQAL